MAAVGILPATPEPGALTSDDAYGALAVAVAGVVGMVPGIALAIQHDGEAIAAAGSLLTAASMLLFVYTVFRNGLGKPA